jgi:hypothetical protein
MHHPKATRECSEVTSLTEADRRCLTLTLRLLTAKLRRYRLPLSTPEMIGIVRIRMEAEGLLAMLERQDPA